MARRRSGNRWDTTRNFRHTRLIVIRPGDKPRTVEARSPKEVRSALKRHLTPGATVIEQEHTGSGMYRTVHTHQPAQEKEPAA